MSLGRLLIVGVLVLAAVYMVAAAITALIPYALGAFVIWVTGAGIHSWLVGKDEATSTISTQDNEAP